jgi:ribosomal protein L12E/L44/L45/RPP1/RPP2
LHDLIREGSTKLASIGAPSGNYSFDSLPSLLINLFVLGASVAAAPAQAAAKVEEKPEKKEEEADVDMGGLFGDDY